ncbi:MAG: aspartyl protease family protein [Candidatus Acidiferrales bacterium]
MHFLKRACALMILTFVVLGVVQSAAPAKHNKKPKPTPEEIAQADRLFHSGSFAEAQQAYVEIAAKDPKDFHAASQLGYIALLSNKLDDAEQWLRKALDLKHGDADAKIMLAEALYRKNDFFHASRALQGLGPEDAAKLKNYSTLNVAKLESFRDEDPYKFERDPGESTRLPFIASDPLPVVNVRVNSGPEVAFFIDTGGSELLLDSEFARELNVKPMGSVQGTFSGGQHAQVENGRVDSLTLGSWTLRNIPVGMLPLRSMSSGFGVKQINGCIGTNVLYQFLSTIDYRTGELILRKKNAANLKRFDAAGGPPTPPGIGKRSAWHSTQSNSHPGVNSAPSTNVTNGIVVPMWMAGDHFMVAWGRVNTQPISLFFVDSGLAGAGVKLTESAIQQAGIHLDESKASEGQGGGGMLKIIPYTVGQFTVGEITEQNMAGLYDGPFPWENEFGFHLAGMFGSDFLKHHAVTFDFTNMRIIFR